MTDSGSEWALNSSRTSSRSWAGYCWSPALTDYVMALMKVFCTGQRSITLHLKR